MSGKPLELPRNLHCKLPCRDQDQSLDSAQVWLDPLKHWQRIGQCFAGPGLRLADQITPFQEWRYCLVLYRERLIEAHVPDALEKTRIQSERLEALSQIIQSRNNPALLTLSKETKMTTTVDEVSHGRLIQRSIRM